MGKSICFLMVMLSLLLTACGTGLQTGFAMSPNVEEEPEMVETTEEIGLVEEIPAGQAIPVEGVEPDTSEEAEEETTVVDLDLSLYPELAGYDEEDILDIGEKMFITQINDMYYNFQDYEDKVVIVEGMYATFYSWDESATCPGVFRWGPGCCGNDGWGGFMLHYEGEIPEEMDWIQVIGTPELITAEDGYTGLYLNVVSLEIKEERGAELVLQ